MVTAGDETQSYVCDLQYDLNMSLQESLNKRLEEIGYTPETDTAQINAAYDTTETAANEIISQSAPAARMKTWANRNRR